MEGGIYGSMKHGDADMRGNRIKSIVLLLLSIILLSTSACLSAPSAQPGESASPASTVKREPYVVKYMTGGAGKQADSDRVLTLFNQQLQDYLPNTYLDFKVVPFNEYGERWHLAVAASEKIDMVWLGWMLSLQTEVNDGSYIQLDDAITAYAPGLWQEFNDWIWDCGRINGKLYAIPIGMGWTVDPRCIFVPTELVERYLDLIAYNKAQQEWEKSGDLVPPDALLDVLENFLAKAKAGGNLGIGISTSVIRNFVATWYDVPCGSMTMIPPAFTRQEDMTSTVVSILDVDLSRFFIRMARWYQEGYIRKDALTVKDEVPDRISNGFYQKKMIMESAGFDQYLSIKNWEARWGLPVTALMLQTYRKTPVGKHGTALAIPATVGNLQRTLELVNLLWTATGSKLTDLLAYGIEGVHYERVTGNYIRTFEYDNVDGGNINCHYGLPDWTVANARYTLKNQGYSPSFIRDRLALEASARIVPLTGFGVDTQPVKLELTQYDMIATKYCPGLFYGTFADPIAAYQEMNNCLEAAGVGRIAKELQRQINSFLAKK